MKTENVDCDAFKDFLLMNRSWMDDYDEGKERQDRTLN